VRSAGSKVIDAFEAGHAGKAGTKRADFEAPREDQQEKIGRGLAS
jgi:hypothetical protein